jgi:hypothetical protein
VCQLLYVIEKLVILYNDLFFFKAIVSEVVIPRVDTTSARYVEHKEIRGYFIRRQGFQKCYRILFKGMFSYFFWRAYYYQYV